MNMSLNKRKSRHIGLVLGVILIIAFVTVSTGFTAAPTKVAPLARNVIVLVPDGMNATAVTLTRWYQGSPLTMDQILTGA